MLVAISSFSLGRGRASVLHAHRTTRVLFCVKNDPTQHHSHLPQLSDSGKEGVIRVEVDLRDCVIETELMKRPMNSPNFASFIHSKLCFVCADVGGVCARTCASEYVLERVCAYLRVFFTVLL